jgi:hypothetical protein
VTIEFYAFLSDGYGQIEHTVLLQDSRQALERTRMSIDVWGIAIAAKPYVFQGVETRNGIGVIVKSIRIESYVALPEADILDLHIQRTYIQNFDWTK